MVGRDHVHRVGLDELHLRALRCATICCLCRPQSRSAGSSARALHGHTVCASRLAGARPARGAHQRLPLSPAARRPLPAGSRGSFARRQVVSRAQEIKDFGQSWRLRRKFLRLRRAGVQRHSAWLQIVGCRPLQRVVWTTFGKSAAAGSPPSPPPLLSPASPTRHVPCAVATVAIPDLASHRCLGCLLQAAARGSGARERPERAARGSGARQRHEAEARGSFTVPEVRVGVLARAPFFK